MSLESGYLLSRRKSRVTESPDELLRQAEDAYTAGDLEATERFAQRVLATEPDSAGALVLAGFIAAQQGRDGQAIQYLSQAVELDPNLWGPRTSLAALFEKQQRYREAIRYWLEALAIRPGETDLLLRVGVCYLQIGSPADAGAFLEMAANATPPSVEASFYLGAALVGIGRPKSAVDCYQRVLQWAPDSVEVRLKLRELGEPSDDYHAQVERFPESPEGQLWFAKAANETGDPQEAERLMAEIVRTYPDYPDARSHLGVLLQQAGRFQEGNKHLEAAIELRPRWSGLYVELVSGRKITLDDRPLLDRMEELLADPELPDTDQAKLHMALGKAYDNLGEYQVAMNHFDMGNEISDRLVNQPIGGLNRGEYEAIVDNVLSTFDAEFLRRHSHDVLPDPRPVFIVGMMRSGTTLTEQILASHPEVGDGGELKYWHNRWTEYLRVKTTESLEPLFPRWGEAFLAILRSAAPNKALVTDKQPENFHSLGLILASIPNALIVHCRRHPIDTCLSMYMTPNLRGVPWAHNKRDMVFMYREYLRMMEHWRSVLSPHQFIEVDYEKLVARPEEETRKIVAFCGLEWSDGCLQHEQAKSMIRTPSLWQARQPIYQSSKERWRNYEPWLGELRTLLG